MTVKLSFGGSLEVFAPLKVVKTDPLGKSGKASVKNSVLSTFMYLGYLRSLAMQ